MGKKKIKFNIIDIIIVLILVAAAVVLLDVFVGVNNDISAETNYTTIQYVIEFQDIEERFGREISKGDVVQDAIERKNIGTVVGVQSAPYEKVTFDYYSGVETVSTVEGKVVILVTIEAVVSETDRAFTVDGCEIRVGQQYSVVLPGFNGAGYCIKITEIDKK